MGSLFETSLSWSYSNKPHGARPSRRFFIGAQPPAKRSDIVLEDRAGRVVALRSKPRPLSAATDVRGLDALSKAVGKNWVRGDGALHGRERDPIRRKSARDSTQSYCGKNSKYSIKPTAPPTHGVICSIIFRNSGFSTWLSSSLGERRWSFLQHCHHGRRMLAPVSEATTSARVDLPCHVCISSAQALRDSGPRMTRTPKSRTCDEKPRFALTQGIPRRQHASLLLIPMHIGALRVRMQDGSQQHGHLRRDRPRESQGQPSTASLNFSSVRGGKFARNRGVALRNLVNDFRHDGR